MIWKLMQSEDNKAFEQKYWDPNRPKPPVVADDLAVYRVCLKVLCCLPFTIALFSFSIFWMPWNIVCLSVATGLAVDVINVLIVFALGWSFFWPKHYDPQAKDILRLVYWISILIYLAIFVFSDCSLVIGNYIESSPLLSPILNLIISGIELLFPFFHHIRDVSANIFKDTGMVQELIAILRFFFFLFWIEVWVLYQASPYALKAFVFDENGRGLFGLRAGGLIFINCVGVFSVCFLYTAVRDGQFIYPDTQFQLNNQLNFTPTYKEINLPLLFTFWIPLSSRYLISVCQSRIEILSDQIQRLER